MSSTNLTAESKAEAALNFILLTLSTAGDLNPDFHQVCSKTGMTLPRNAQQKFKKLVEQSGRYVLINGKVTDMQADSSEDGDTSVATTPSKPATSRGKAAGPTRKRAYTNATPWKTNTALKRKNTTTDDDVNADNGSDGAGVATGTKQGGKGGAGVKKQRVASDDHSDHDETADYQELFCNGEPRRAPDVVEED